MNIFKEYYLHAVCDKHYSCPVFCCGKIYKLLNLGLTIKIAFVSINLILISKRGDVDALMTDHFNYTYIYNS